jgi:drug/metabolite transporter (DMT)-like permease
MIITGSARSVVVKLAYQGGFRAPLTVTLLYLAGQSLSLFVYMIQKRVRQCFAHGYDVLVTAENVQSKQQHISSDTKAVELCMRRTLHENKSIPKGSSHGLTIQSEERIQWIHCVPWYAKPAIPAFFNLLNAALRWASLVHIDASVAEMLISGLELALSVVAARIFRSRRIGMARWMGVILVAVGIIIIERANSSKHQATDEREDSKQYDGEDFFGVILIISQSILSVLQDIAEEIFMQAADFPPTMMLGMEGLYGFSIGLITYFTIGDKLRIEDTSSTIQLLRENTKMRWWIFGLPFLFLVTGIFNIKATEVTSAMTRNVWKNFRTALVWVLSLFIFYFGGNGDYGEAWFIPESFYILLGLMVMSAGIVVYYWYKNEDRKEESLLTPCAEESNVV